jgi:hypothetical protein
VLQLCPPLQLPQELPHPLSPHTLPSQEGTQMFSHWLSLLQNLSEEHRPHVPPHPSLPHTLSVHSGVHVPKEVMIRKSSTAWPSKFPSWSEASDNVIETGSSVRSWARSNCMIITKSFPTKPPLASSEAGLMAFAGTTVV